MAVSPTEEMVFSAALALPEQSRAQLADMLWTSLPEERLDLCVPEEVRQGWAEEARRRMQDVQTGNVSLLPGDEVRGPPSPPDAEMNYHFHPDAEDELHGTYEYYEAEREGLGRRFGEAFDEALVRKRG